MGLGTTRLRRRVAAAAATLGLAAFGLVATALPSAAAEGDPAIAVFLADGTTPYTDQVVTDGDTLVVKGTGFDPAANVGGRGVPIPADLPQGDYVAFGSFAPTWQPSAGAPAAARASDSSAQVWLLAESVLDKVPAQYQGAIRTRWAPIADDGTFTATLTVAVPEEIPADGVWGVYTYPAGGISNAAHELAIPVNYSADPAPATTASTPVPTPTEASPMSAPVSTTTTPEVQCRVEDVPATAGTPRLDWPVKRSFLGYVDSSLADGAVTAGSGAAWNGSTVTWGSGSGTLGTGSGSVTFPGSLHIEGHEGVLNLTISKLTVKVTGAKTGVLEASVTSSDMNGNPVSASGVLADLTFSSIGATGGKAAATLSATGAKAFAGFYNAGEALDPLTITVSGGSAASSVTRCYDADGNLVDAAGNRLDSLASTGINMTGMTTFAAALLLLGGVALTLARRGRGSRTEAHTL